MASPLSDDDNDVRVVLLGNTGSGKSRLAQNIAESNTDNLFKVDRSTGVVKQISVNLSDRNLIIINTPGYKNKDDTNYDKDLAASLDKIRPGPNIFLICIPVGRCTKEINEMLEKHVKFFGENINRFTIFIFTHIDQWIEDMKELGRDTDFQQYIDSLPEAIRKCSSIREKRYCQINNRLTGEENKQQIEQLISTILNLVSVNDRKCFVKEIETTMIENVGYYILNFIRNINWLFLKIRNPWNNNE